VLKTPDINTAAAAAAAAGGPSNLGEHSPALPRIRRQQLSSML